MLLYLIEYNSAMHQIETTEAFDAWMDGWMDGLKDALTRKRLGLRLRKAELGNLGDVKPVGGDKAGQAKDIAAAIELARLFKE